MRRYRVVVGLLLALALQISAAVSVASAFGCRHATAHQQSALADADVPQQHDHAAMMHMDHGAHAAAGQSCDCPAQCDCAHHCTTGGCIALPIREVRVAAQACVESMRAVSYADRVRDPQTSPPFRPPIVAPNGAV